jgi:hypothetical protein
MATVDADLWCLRSAEESHRAHPDRFWIPAKDDRERLTPGQGVKLIFDISVSDENGSVTLLGGERMWVIVTERIGDAYIGILDNEPASLDPAADHYLRLGAEIPFRAEHVIDIGSPAVDYVARRFSQKPPRVWPRS